MAIYLIGYTVIILVVCFFAFVMLVGYGVIFKNNQKIKNIFGRPLLVYSVRRIISALALRVVLVCKDMGVLYTGEDSVGSVPSKV